MSAESRGMLLVWTDVADGAEDDFNAWYDQEHLPERVGVPGFINGRRYHGAAASPRYFAVYGTAGVRVLTGPAYLERLDNPTPWSQRVMPTFRNTVRSICQVAGVQGESRGKAMLTLRCNAAPGRRESLREALLERLELTPGVARICLGIVAETAGQGPLPGTGETDLRGPDATTEFALLMEGAQDERLAAARSAQFADQWLLEAGAAQPLRQDIYHLLKALDA